MCQEHLASQRRDALRELRLAVRLWCGRTSEQSCVHGYQGSLKGFLLHIARLRRGDAADDGPLGHSMVLAWDKIIEEIEGFESEEA